MEHENLLAKIKLAKDIHMAIEKQANDRCIILELVKFTSKV